MNLPKIVGIGQVIPKHLDVEYFKLIFPKNLAFSKPIAYPCISSRMKNI